MFNRSPRLRPGRTGRQAFAPAGHVRAFCAARRDGPDASTGLPAHDGGCPAGGRAHRDVCRGAAAGRARRVVDVRAGAAGRRRCRGALAAVLMAASPPLLDQIVSADVRRARRGHVGARARRCDRALVRLVIRRCVARRDRDRRRSHPPESRPVAAVAAFAVFIERPRVSGAMSHGRWICSAPVCLPFAFVIAILQNAMDGGPLDVRLWTARRSRFGSTMSGRTCGATQRGCWKRKHPSSFRALRGAVARRHVAGREATPSCSPSLPRCWRVTYRTSVRCAAGPRVPAARIPRAPGVDGAAIAGLLSHLHQRWRTLGLIAVALVAIVLVRTAVARGAFDLREFEHRSSLPGIRRVGVAGECRRDHAQESGSVRFDQDV